MLMIFLEKKKNQNGLKMDPSKVKKKKKKFKLVHDIFGKKEKIKVD